MKDIGKLQDAKSQFSKVVEDNLLKDPQYVTRNEGNYSAAQVPIMNPWSKQGDTRSED
jgi:hypothetical protein